MYVFTHSQLIISDVTKVLKSAINRILSGFHLSVSFFQLRTQQIIIVPISVAAPRQAWVGGRSPDCIAGSNPAAAMDVFLF